MTAKASLSDALEDLAAVLGPQTISQIDVTDRQNLAKYLTIAKLRLENAIAALRIGESQLELSPAAQLRQPAHRQRSQRDRLAAPAPFAGAPSSAHPTGRRRPAPAPRRARTVARERRLLNGSPKSVASGQRVDDHLQDDERPAMPAGDRAAPPGRARRLEHPAPRRPGRWPAAALGRPGTPPAAAPVSRAVAGRRRRARRTAAAKGKPTAKGSQLKAVRFSRAS